MCGPLSKVTAPAAALILTAFSAGTRASEENFTPWGNWNDSENDSNDDGHGEEPVNPIVYTTNMAIVDDLNRRFRVGRPTNRLYDAGILIHQWDNTEGTGEQRLWMPCQKPWCAKWGDRMSTSIISKGTSRPQERNSIGIFSHKEGGFIIAPKQVELLCSYHLDGGSMDIICDQQGRRTKKCLPGCNKKKCTKAVYWECSWPRKKLDHMLSFFKAGKGAGYNEVVIGTENWNPDQIIEAFFWPVPLGKSCRMEACDDRCERTWNFRMDYLAEQNQSGEGKPFLCLDLLDWEHPFKSFPSEDLEAKFGHGR